jgi:adenylosuccinate lyase
MCRLFGADHRVKVWRRLWIALAEGQRKAGLKVTAGQIADLRRVAEDVNFQAAARYEKELRHDVMAHLHAFADQAPSARPILHVGATSAFIVDNADLIIMRDALALVRNWLANAVDALARLAAKYRDLPTLGLTHFQPAQLTTVGKRAALWCYDFVRDLEEIERRLDTLKFRGVKGTTGTQASFMALFDGDEPRIDALERDVAQAFDFDAVEPITGQTYSRKIDAQVVSALAGIAASVHKFANDVRLLSGLKEIDEPFESTQVGSSAMPYKRNPMRCERATGLARFVISLASSPLQTAAEQWFERTLDDSSNRRLVIPDSFLATDGMLRIVLNVARGLTVYPAVIATRVASELPFIATEEILMAGVNAGGDRQDLHERLRRHTQEAARVIKESGEPNDLLDRLAADEAFAKIDFTKLLEPSRFIGRAPVQVDEFLRTVITPIRERYQDELGMASELTV